MLKKTVVVASIFSAALCLSSFEALAADPSKSDLKLCAKIVKLQQKQADRCAKVKGNMTEKGTPLYKCYHETYLSRKIDRMVDTVRSKNIKCPV